MMSDISALRGQVGPPERCAVVGDREEILRRECHPGDTCDGALDA